MKSIFQVGLNWWSAWQQRSVNQRIFGAMVTVGVLTTLVKLAAAAKEMAIAYHFGTNDEFDAFLIALVVPAFAVNLIGGSLNAALIPSYIRVREQEGQPAAERLLSSVMVVSISFLVILSVILAFSASYILPLVASGFSGDKMAMTRSLYYGLLSTIVVSGVTTTWGAILNAENRFALVAVAPVVTSIITIPVVIVMAQYWGGYVLVIGMVTGALVEAWFVGWGLTRLGVSLIPRWCGTSPAVKQVFRQYLPVTAAAFLMSSTGVVSQSMAATLDAGSVSAFAYGSKVTNLMLGIGALAVSTAVLPHFSRVVTMGDWHGLRQIILTYSCWLLLGTIPVAALLIYYSETVVAFVFQRGAFTEADSHLAGQVQAMLLLHVPVYTVGMMFVRLVSALNANYLMLWSNVINFMTFVCLTYVLMPHLGVVGIALATSIMYCVSVLFLVVTSLWMIKERNLTNAVTA